MKPLGGTKNTIGEHDETYLDIAGIMELFQNARSGRFVFRDFWELELAYVKVIIQKPFLKEILHLAQNKRLDLANDFGLVYFFERG